MTDTYSISPEEYDDFTNMLCPIAKDCILGKYILIVGSECILDPQKRSDIDGDSTKLILKSIADNLGYVKHPSEEEENLKKKQIQYDTIKNIEGLDSLKEDYLNQIKTLKDKIDTNRLQKIPSINELTHLYNDATIKKTKLTPKYDAGDFNPELRKLLRTKCFRVVITTAVDRFLENEMRDIWGDELQVLNIFDNRDWEMNVKPINDFCDTPPTLYYAFGSLHNGRQFVLTEDDAMEAIALWGGNERPKKFGTYLSNSDKKKMKYLISIGCNLENWQFRFFWYQLLGERLRDQIDRGAVVMTFADNHKLKKYLDENWLLKTVDKTQFFLQTLYEAIDQQLGFHYPPSNYIFISYAHENNAVAHALASMLIEKGFNVWLDTKLAHDGKDPKYDSRIENAIKGCTVFLPILTSDVAHELTTGETLKTTMTDLDGNKTESIAFKRYFFQEWQWMELSLKENPRKQYVQPVAYSGFNINADYYKNITQECITKSSVFTTSSGSFDILCKQLEGIMRSNDWQ